ncbi:MAG: helix-hairpin-helix domain-containing protein, partial [Allosphingosinicella sp.]
DDIETLGFMKVDILGLGMLGCMRRAFDLLAEHKGLRIDLSAPELQTDCEKTYAMIRKADTIGTFQIESRAQMSMLPRLKPREFYDLVIQVAIVRPGPIQGDMVHPYLRRREGKEKAEYPSEELCEVLGKTLGVPLFQEQAMKVAIVGAGFKPAEADALRRSMATFKSTGGVSRFHDQMIEGMVAKGYERDFAERTFRQIEGFGSYGFPESHAASFAKIAYASSWMKCHHPEIFCAALVNAQPMGFYQPAQIVRDAREHEVEVRPVCIAASDWDCVLEGYSSPAFAGEGDRPKDGGGASSTAGPLHHAAPNGCSAAGSGSRHAPGMPTRLHPPPLQMQGGNCYLPIRLGLRMVKGLSEKDAAFILAARAERSFATIEDVWCRSGVPAATLEKLANADAFHSLGLSRRQALWQVRGLGERPLPLFAAADRSESGREPEARLRPMTEGREVVEDYSAIRLSLRDHPVSFLRPELDRMGITRCADLARVKDGAKILVAGLVLIRQRPGKGNVTFITIEDESGIANIIVWQRKFEAQRRIVMSAAMIAVRGTVQREGDVIHVVTDRLEDHTALLDTIGRTHFPHRRNRVDEASGSLRDPYGKARGLNRAPSSSEGQETIRVKSRNFH